jgi:hypothetical protein
MQMYKLRDFKRIKIFTLSLETSYVIIEWQEKGRRFPNRSDETEDCVELVQEVARNAEEAIQIVNIKKASR